MVEGYPLDWISLENWLKRSKGTELDLRSILLELQFLLENHVQRLELSFTQLQLKNEDETPTHRGRIESNGFTTETNSLQLIDLPLEQASSEWPYYIPTQKHKRYTYDPETDTISDTVGKKKRFSRIIQDDNIFESDSNEQIDGAEESIQSKAGRWVGDLNPLADCFNLQATQDLLQGGLYRTDLSWNDARFIQDVEQFITHRNTKLIESELKDFSKISFDEKMSRQM